MRLASDTAEVFVPMARPLSWALARTTHMGIGAHQDDLEIMAFDGILACFQQRDKCSPAWSSLTAGGSPRDGVYREYSDDEMRRVRRSEQKKAAVVGGYAAQLLLDHPSSAVKDGANRRSSTT